MSYRLFVRPESSAGEDDAILYGWVLLDASGEPQAHGEGDSREHIEHTLGQNALDNVYLIGLIPGDEALLCFADIPARQTRFVMQALPYAVEEQIAQDIESVHLALGPRDENGFRVAAIDRGAMATWSARFSGWEHVQLEGIYPDAALLPQTEGGWTLCLDGDDVLLLSDRGEWLRMQADNLTMFAGTLAIPPADEVVAEIPVTVYGTVADFERHDEPLKALSGTGRLKISRNALEIPVPELLAHSFHQHLANPINLCQGNYSVRADGAGSLGPWRPLIAVASLWFILQVGLEIGMGWYYQQQAEEINQQAMSIYRQYFPGDRTASPGNVKRIVQGQMNQLQSGSTTVGFVDLLKYTGEQYRQTAAGDGSVTFNSINYSRNRGELVVDVRASDYSKLNALRSGLTSAGLEASIGSVVNEANGARGRLTVSGG
jgi:general secretion pathway protein L